MLIGNGIICSIFFLLQVSHFRSSEALSLRKSVPSPLIKIPYIRYIYFLTPKAHGPTFPYKALFQCELSTRHALLMESCHNNFKLTQQIRLRPTSFVCLIFGMGVLSFLDWVFCCFTIVWSTTDSDLLLYQHTWEPNHFIRPICAGPYLGGIEKKL